jgi:hypothetical protein
MFGGNGGLPKFIINIPKYLEGFGSPGGPNGFKPPPPRFNGYLAKILSTSLGISICTLISCVLLGIWCLDLILTTVWAGAITNGV